MAKKKSSKTYIIVGVIIAIVVLVYASQSVFGKEGKYDGFAKCLTEKGATFYGTEWCPHCKNQKQLFGSSMKYVNYVDCDKKADICLREGIKAYPTWKIPGEEPMLGTQQFSRLSSLTGCES